MRHFLVGIILLGCLASAPASGKLPPDAVRILSTLPEGSVTLDVVLARAIQRSESFRQVQALEQATEIPYLRGRIPFESRVYSQARWNDDRNEPVIPFMPINIKSRSLLVGAATAFPTGTGLVAELGHGDVHQTVSGVPTSYFESEARFTLTQNLWQDAFGAAGRNQLAAGELGRAAAREAFQEGVEDWATSLMDVFYGAWLAQARVFAADDNVERRARLEKITRIKANRGTAEEPDLLQVTSARINAGVQRAETEQALGDRWRALVLGLKLPEAWVAIDPRQIPIKLDDRRESALALCRDPLRSANEQAPSASLKRRRLEAEAAEHSFRAAESMLRPDLELVGGLVANGVSARERSETFREARTVQNPNWAVGVNFTLPLSRYGENANYAQAAADRDRLSALASGAGEDWKLRWLSDCSNLTRMAETVTSLEKAFANQERRVRLEERRFEIGRSSILGVIQAGDDATLAESNLRSAEAALRQASWRVLRLSGGYREYIDRVTKLEVPGL